MTAAAFRELRIIPPALFEARRPQRMLERSVMVYRRTPIIIISGFFEPLFYLLSIRIGFSSLIGDVTIGAAAGVPLDDRCRGDHAGRTHHDLALGAVGDDAGPAVDADPARRRAGLRDGCGVGPTSHAWTPLPSSAQDS